MDSRSDRKRINVEGDRLSSLPDDLIHKVLCFIDIKQAIETSVLSSRWRYIWTSMPCLNFSNKDFLTFVKFSKFITCVMSSRNNLAEVSSIELKFNRKLSQAHVGRILNMILNYESTHNVQKLKFKNWSCADMESPLSLFGSQSQEHLTSIGCKHPITITPTWETLATLKLYHVKFSDDSTTDKSFGSFSNFANLKNLTLKHCHMKGSNVFNICHSRLSNLTLECGFDFESCNVVAPQLKNLSIRSWQNRLMISAPDLASMHYEDGSCSLQLSADFLHLENADICISYISEDKAKAHNIVCLLQQLHSVKVLTLNLEIIKLLSSYVELISHQPSPFANLKRLKICPCDVTHEAKDQTQSELTMSTEVRNYMLDGSPGATFTMVSHDEVRAVMNVTLARNLMSELRMLLDQWKEDSETNTTDMKQEKAPMESHIATMSEQVEVAGQLDANMKWHFTERMTLITKQFVKGNTYIGRAFSLLRRIEGVHTKLPSSLRAKLQARFYGLSAEAEASMNVMVNHLKNQWDKTPSLYFHELATTLLPST